MRLGRDVGVHVKGSNWKVTVKIRDSGPYRLAEHKNIFNCLVFFSARQAVALWVFY